MSNPGTWRKSSFSGGGQGDACVEVTRRPTHISVRDSKVPTRAVLTLRPRAFAAFVNALHDPHSRDTSSASKPSSFSR
ncbi:MULTISPECIES: DUF397 domain-containing protein [unclassified Streptomyces]|uniref:DUF397 domain-containing protein n=1 Tax=unclassified Streptomyces TaxID=2593676 RepID=UPI0034401A81